MAQPNSREIVLLAEGARTTSGTGPDIVLPSMYTGAIVHLNVPTVSGTSPTLAVYIQNKFTPAASTDASGLPPLGTPKYQDLVSFAQSTTSGQVIVGMLVGGGNTTTGAQQDASLTAGAINNGPIGGVWRIKFVVGGTSPSFSFSVSALLLP